MNASDFLNDSAPATNAAKPSASDFLSDTAAKPQPSTYDKIISGIESVELPDKSRVVGPALLGGIGGLTKAVGGVTELFAPETGKKISGVGEALTKKVEEKYPIAGTMGEYGSLIIPGTGALKGVELVSGGGRAASLLGRAGQAAAAGGITGAATTSGDAFDRTIAGVLGATLGGVAEPTVAGVSKAYDVLTRAFSGDAKQLAEALRTYASKTAGKEADAARQLADRAEQRAAMAEKSAAKQERRSDLAFRELPGTKTEYEAGEYKAIPAERQAIGDRIRGYVDDVYDRLKSVRNKNAEANKTEAFGEALAKERAGAKVNQTQAFADTIKDIDAAIKNPETGLTNVVGEAKSQLESVKRQLAGQMVDEASGVVIERPLSFEGLENLRRMLRDRAFGLPDTGYDAIGQQQAGKLANKIESIMEEFSPKIRTFIDQYAADSQPLRVFQSKVGKALMDEQLLGKGANYAAVAAEDIPSKVFKNRDTYQALIDAVGGNTKFAENEARKYFASELEKASGDPRKVAQFIRDNRTMLKLTNSMDMADAYIRQLQTAGRRAGAGQKIAETERDVQSKQQAAAQIYDQFEKDIRSTATTRDPKDIATATQNLADKLRKDKLISDDAYYELVSKANDILDKTADKKLAIQQIATLAKRALPYGVGSGAVYYGVKNFGG